MINQGVSGMPLHKQEEMEAPDEYLPEDETEENIISPNKLKIESQKLDLEIEKVDKQEQYDNEDEGKYFSR